MTGARAIVGALKGHWCGSYGMACCPSHADAEPSLKIADDPRKNDGIDLHCFGGCSWRDIKDALRKIGLLDEFKPDSTTRRSVDFKVGMPAIEPEPDDEAIAIWRNAVGITDDTIAAIYLRKRGLIGPYPASLRYAAGVKYRPAGLILPGLVAAVSHPDRRVVAVQVTYLRPDGSKAPISIPRFTFGKMGTGAIRLAAATDTLGLAEGVETALSAMTLTGIPTWSCVGGRRMGKITIPPGVRTVHLFADNDEPGQAAAEDAAKRFSHDGMTVRIKYPADGLKDFNDALRGAA